MRRRLKDEDLLLCTLNVAAKRKIKLFFFFACTPVISTIDGDKVHNDSTHGKNLHEETILIIIKKTKGRF